MENCGKVSLFPRTNHFMSRESWSKDGFVWLESKENTCSFTSIMKRVRIMWWSCLLKRSSHEIYQVGKAHNAWLIDYGVKNGAEILRFFQSFSLSQSTTFAKMLEKLYHSFLHIRTCEEKERSWVWRKGAEKERKFQRFCSSTFDQKKSIFSVWLRHTTGSPPGATINLSFIAEGQDDDVDVIVFLKYPSSLCAHSP